MQKFFILALLLLPFISVPSSAMGPSPKIEEAINQPVSYFRFGLLQLEEHIEENVSAALGLQPGHNGEMASVIYQFDENRIDIMLLNFSRYNVTKEAAAQYCASKVRELRRLAGVNEEGELRLQKHSRFANRMASFKGFEKSWEESVLQEFDRIMHLTVTVRWDVNSSPFSCYGPLISDKVWAKADESQKEPWLIQ